MLNYFTSGPVDGGPAPFASVALSNPLLLLLLAVCSVFCLAISLCLCVSHNHCGWNLKWLSLGFASKSNSDALNGDCVDGTTTEPLRNGEVHEWNRSLNSFFNTFPRSSANADNTTNVHLQCPLAVDTTSSFRPAKDSFLSPNSVGADRQTSRDRQLPPLPLNDSDPHPFQSTQNSPVALVHAYENLVTTTTPHADLSVLSTPTLSRSRRHLFPSSRWPSSVVCCFHGQSPSPTFTSTLSPLRTRQEPLPSSPDDVLLHTSECARGAPGEALNALDEEESASELDPIYSTVAALHLHSTPRGDPGVMPVRPTLDLMMADGPPPPAAVAVDIGGRNDEDVQDIDAYGMTNELSWGSYSSVANPVQVADTMQSDGMMPIYASIVRPRRARPSPAPTTAPIEVAISTPSGTDENPPPNLINSRGRPRAIHMTEAEFQTIVSPLVSDSSDGGGPSHISPHGSGSIEPYDYASQGMEIVPIVHTWSTNSSTHDNYRRLTVRESLASLRARNALPNLDTSRTNAPLYERTMEESQTGQSLYDGLYSTVEEQQWTAARHNVYRLSNVDTLSDNPYAEIPEASHNSPTVLVSETFAPVTPAMRLFDEMLSFRHMDSDLDLTQSSNMGTPNVLHRRVQDTSQRYPPPSSSSSSLRPISSSSAGLDVNLLPHRPLSQLLINHYHSSSRMTPLMERSVECSLPEERRSLSSSNTLTFQVHSSHNHSQKHNQNSAL